VHTPFCATHELISKKGPFLRIVRAVHARDTMKHEFVVLVLLLLFASALCTDVCWQRAERESGESDANANGDGLCVLWHKQVIGVHPIFGGFFMGVITPREHRFAVGMTERIEVGARGVPPYCNNPMNLIPCWWDLVHTTGLDHDYPRAALLHLLWPQDQLEYSQLLAGWHWNTVGDRSLHAG